MDLHSAGQRADPARAGGWNVVKTLFDNLALAGQGRHRLALRSWRVISIEDKYLISCIEAYLRRLKDDLARAGGLCINWRCPADAGWRAGRYSDTLAGGQV